MRRRFLIFVAILVATAIWSPVGSAHALHNGSTTSMTLKQKERLQVKARAHARGVVRVCARLRLNNRTCRWHRAQLRWVSRELRETRRAMNPPIPYGEAALRAYINDDCLEELIDRETAGTWNPRIYNGKGSGAYGLPQALPGSKMKSAGPDWLWNPLTQIRWMRGYVMKYGGSCGALVFHNANHWY